MSFLDFGQFLDNHLLSKHLNLLVLSSDAPSTPAITSDPHSAEEASYTLTWTTDSYYPITQYKLMYRKTKVGETGLVYRSAKIGVIAVMYRNAEVDVTNVMYTKAKVEVIDMMNRKTNVSITCVYAAIRSSEFCSV